MAEAIGTASAVLGLAEVAAKASLQLYQFFTTIRNAPQEIISISRNIKNFNLLVCNLQGALASPDIQEIVHQDHEINRALKDLQDPMDNCRLACDRVMRKLIPHLQLKESAHGGSEDGSKRRMRRGDVMWFWRRREVFALMTDLERTKAMFSDAMGSLTLLLTFRTSAIMTTSANVPMRHKFDDDAGSAIVHFASVVESEQPSGISSVTTLTPSEAKADKENDPEFTRELLQAVRVGSTTLVMIMLKQVDINARDPLDGRTALLVAAEYGNVKIAKFLLSHGAAVDIRQYSFSNHYIDGEHPMLFSGRFPLHWAAVRRHSEVVELLLQLGANPNARTSSGRPALQEACIGDDPESVKVLLENGADVNARSYNHGWTALHEAAHLSHFEIRQILLHYKPLLNIPATHEPQGATPLYFAFRDQNIDIANRLLAEGADPNVPIVEDITPLHLAATAGWIDGINALLDKGAFINPRDEFLRETPLHKAARNLEKVAIKVLCARGADEELKNIDGLDYRGLLECAERYPDEWRVGDDTGTYYTYY